MAVKKKLVATISAEDRQFQRTMTRVKRTALDIGRGIAKIGAAGGVAFLAASKITLDYADRIDKVSQRLGMTTDEYQRLSLAAAQAGLNQEQFAVGMQALTKNLGGAIQGEMGQVKALQAIGIAIKDIKGKSSIDQLMKVGEALSNITDQNKRMKIAGQLFGDEAGARMLVLFAQGAEGVAAAMARIGKGSLLTPEQIQSAVKLNDQLTVTKAILMGGLASLLSDTWPKMEEGIRDATAGLVKFSGSADFKAMKGEIKDVVSELADLGKQLGPIVLTGIHGLTAINGLLGTTISSLTKTAELMNAVIDGFDSLGNDILRGGGNFNRPKGVFGPGVNPGATGPNAMGGEATKLGKELLEFLKAGPLGEGK